MYGVNHSLPKPKMLIQYNNHNRGIEPDYFELYININYRDLISVETAIFSLAEDYKKRAVQIIKNYNPFINEKQILKSVKGIVGASYKGGGSMDQSEVYTLNEITPEVLFEISERILQSNSSVTIQELVWTFIFIPDSFSFSGGGNIRVPVQVKFFKETWKEHQFNNEPISCAAYALTTWENKKRCERIGMIEKKSWILQKKLGWEKYTTNYQFEEYLEHKKNLKIVIINMKTLKGISYIGKAWKFDEDYKKNTIFLFNSLTDENGEHCSHYSLISGPLLFHSINHHKWCANCDLIITANENHHCEKVSFEPRKRKMYECEYCEKSYYSKKAHKCFHFKCKTCKTFRKWDEFDHVCVLQAEEPYEGNGEEINVFAYDLESIIKSTPSSSLKITKLKTDENGKYPFTDSVEEIVERRESYIQDHKVNLVCFKNIITGEEGHFFGDDCIEKFITFLYNYKDGKCIAIAHNASGYDSRFIFEESLKFVRDKERKIITRGTKILQLKLGSLTFIDSLPHLPGSLKKIGKDFGCTTEKGHFPFLFNQPENYNYIGSIPDLEYFGIDFCKTEKDYKELLEWHASWSGRNDWNFMNEFLKYCKNDVDMLAEICKGYMNEWLARGIQPWLKPTGPGVVHQYIKMIAWAYILKNYPPPEDEKSQEYLEWHNYIARNKFWCVLTDYENNFARAALRGGRTEVKMMHYKLSEEDYQKGVRIAYPDVKSLYPSQQILQEDIPVGKPTVYIYDKRYLDCNCKIMKTDIKCNCDPEKKIRLSGIKKRIENREIIIEEEQPADFNDFFGIVCVTLQPPKNLYHPVLILKDEEKMKCIPTLEDEAHVEIVVDTPNFLKCIEKGYKVLKIHSYHKYNKSNLMKYATMELFIQKEKNSRDEPTNEEKKVMTEKWGEVYGDWAVKLLQESFGDWGNNPAKRLIYKIAVNSGWGKMCQRTKLPICDIIDYNNEKDLEIYKAKLNDCGRGVVKFKGVKQFGGGNAMLTTEDYKVRADLHDVYLPAGLFIPAYGRLKLYEQLEKLGLRVIYMDTDSVIYIYIPGEYNVPLGDGLGEWELEDYCTKTDIMEIVGMSAKTYGLKMRDGSKMVKAKGLIVNRNCENIVNFENMKNVVLKFCNEEKDNGLFTPQTNFKYVMGQGVTTEINFKHIGIKKEELKGVLKDMKIYPFGYDESLIK
jgi:hypothetical protein